MDLYNYDEILLGLIQLRLHHRNNQDITISRICFKAGYLVVGGFSRLIKHAINWCFSNGYDKVITWSDNRLTDGQIYQDSGFIKSYEFKPAFYYAKDGVRISQQSMQKRKIEVPPIFTYHEWISKLGYKRIYDCGKIKWVYYKPA